MTSLLAESEDVGEEQDGQQQADDLDDHFDNDEEEEYKEEAEEEEQDVGKTEDELLELFGDVDDIENEERDAQEKESGGEACESLNKSKEDLQGLCCSSFTLNLPLVVVKCSSAQLKVTCFILFITTSLCLQRS